MTNSKRRDSSLDLMALAILDLPKRWTYVDAKKKFGWDRTTVIRVVHRFRMVFGDEALPCVPNGKGQPYVYCRTNDLNVNLRWHRNRLDDAITRAATLEASAITVRDNTDGRTKEHAIADMWADYYGRIRRDLSRINERFANGA